MDVPEAMGSAIAINFQPTGSGKAAITGDFVLTADEVNPVIRALRVERHRGDGDPQPHAQRRATPVLHAFLGQRRCPETRERTAGGARPGEDCKGLGERSDATSDHPNARSVIRPSWSRSAYRMGTPRIPRRFSSKRRYLSVMSSVGSTTWPSISRASISSWPNSATTASGSSISRPRRLLGRITGLKEPQGVGYVPSTDVLYVANAGDGSVRLFRGADFKETGRIDLGDDADNVRIDTVGRRVFVGYGKGALAVIDTESNARSPTSLLTAIRRVSGSRAAAAGYS